MEKGVIFIILENLATKFFQNLDNSFPLILIIVTGLYTEHPRTSSQKTLTVALSSSPIMYED